MKPTKIYTTKETRRPIFINGVFLSYNEYKESYLNK